MPNCKSTTEDRGEEEWENHRAEISAMYLEEDYTLERIRQTMAERHNFHATKYHFERHLKKWALRKNFSPTEWEAIGSLVRKRKRCNKDSEILSHGVVLAPKKVKKALERYTSRQDVTPSPPPLPPTGVIIRTPPHASSTFNETLVELRSSPCASFWIDLLPFQLFQSSINIEVERPLAAPSKASEMFAAVLYFISNKMLSATMRDLAQLYSWIKQSWNVQVLETLYAKGGPSMESFIEQLAQFAVMHEDVQMVGRILRLTLGQLHPDQIRCPKALTGYHGDTPEKCVRFGNNSRFELTSLQYSCRQRNTELAKVLIQNGADTNHLGYKAMPNYAESPILLALGMTIDGITTTSLPWNLIQTLLEAGARIDLPVDDETSIQDYLLIGASAICHLDIINFLLAAGANPNPTLKRNRNQMIPILAAIGSSSSTEDKILVVSRLMQEGTDLRYLANESFHGYQPCSAHRKLKFRRLCDLESGIDPCALEFEATHSPLTCAIFQSNLDLVNFLLDHGAPVTEDALAAAAEVNWPEMIIRFLKSKVKFNNQSIHYMLYHRMDDMLQLLFEDNSFCLDKLNWKRCFVAAITCGHHVMLKNILARGFDVRDLDHARFDLKLEEAVRNIVRKGCLVTFKILIDTHLIQNDAILLSTAFCESIREVQEQITQLCLQELQHSPGFAASLNADVLGSALQFGKVVLAKELLELGIEPNYPCLELSISLGDPSLLSILISACNPTFISEAIDDIDGGFEPDNSKCQPDDLMALAVRKENIEIVQTVLNSTADINIELALKTAVEIGNKALFDLLLANGADPHNELAFMAAIITQNLDLTLYFLEKGINISDESLLLASVAYPEIVQRILSTSQINLHCRGFGCNSLQASIRLGRFHIVKNLLSSGVNPNTGASSRVNSNFQHRILRLGDYLWKCVHGKLCGKNSLTVDSRCVKCTLGNYRGKWSGSALGDALERTDGEKYIKALLSHGANPNLPTWNKFKREVYTPFLLAIRKNAFKEVDLFLKSGAELNPSFTCGCTRTPLQKSAEMGHLKMTEMLIGLGARVNAPPATRYGATALQLAAIKGNLDVAVLLLEKGAEVNGAPAKIGGRTAIEGACEYGHIDMIALLVSAGAVLIETGITQYKRAREFARNNGHMAAYRLIERYYYEQMGCVAASMLQPNMALENGPLDPLDFSWNEEAQDETAVPMSDDFDFGDWLSQDFHSS